MDDEWDDLHGEIADLDVTGDPQLDVYGYQSPRTPRPRPGFKAGPERDWLAQSKRDRQQRAARRQRRSKAASDSKLSEPPTSGRPQPMAQPARVEPEPRVQVPEVGPQPGQHGAYFEVRTVRRWWAPWRKKQVWQQISTWQAGQPPAGATVVTVGDVAQLPGRVHTIGRVSGTGAVEY